MTLLSSTALTQWYGTLTPYIIICLLYVVTIVTAFVGLRTWTARRITLIIMPICIILGSVFEVMALTTMGKGAFWWCSEEKYGFWGAYFRCIPFLVTVFAQVMSYLLYKNILVWTDSDESLSIWPMAKSIALCIPAAVVVAMIMAGIGKRGTEMELATIGTFLVVLIIGTFKSTRSNIKILGTGRGLAFTAFGVIYVIGMLVMLWGLILVCMQLWLQMLISLPVVCILMAVLSGDKVDFIAPKPKVSRNLDGTWNDGYGGVHKEKYLANIEHREITERRRRNYGG